MNFHKRLKSGWFTTNLLGKSFRHHWMRECFKNPILHSSNGNGCTIWDVWKTFPCKLIPNWTRNRMTTYTNKNWGISVIPNCDCSRLPKAKTIYKKGVSYYCISHGSEKKKACLFVYIYYTQCYCCGTEHLGVSGLMLASLIPRRSEELPLDRLRIRQGLGRFEGNWKKSLKPESTAYSIHAPLYLVTVVCTLWLATPTHRNKHASRLRNLCKYSSRQHIIYLARIDFYFLGSSAS